MGILDVFSTFLQVPTLRKLKKGMQPRPATETDCIANRIEHNAARHGDRVAVIFEETTITWSELNGQANRYAHTLRNIGVQRGDTVSVIMENRIEFLVTIIALNKLGAIAGLINNNLRGRQLTHCISVTDSTKCIFGAEVREALQDVKADLSLREGNDYFFVPDTNSDVAPNWAQDLAESSVEASEINLPSTQDITLGETCFYIFTSGTTGLPKAAILSNRRYLSTATLSAQAGLKCTEHDRLYICLPLYHGTALMVGLGASIASGASMFIRRKFSSSNFLKDVREHRATCFIYIGELCRYLCNTPRKNDDNLNPLTRMMGNGLRPDVWMEFKTRFGIKRVSEFYGASEGNVAFANLLNKDCTVGMTSSKVALVKYDINNDEILRDPNGRCIAVEKGDPGLLLGHINYAAEFEGYTNSEATEKKIVRGAFEEADSWFNSGDLLREVDVGFTLGYPHYQFVDRVGDTYRWKSENISTNEVGEIINGHPQVEFCNVYGVEIPNADGRAGMVSLQLHAESGPLDLEGFGNYVARELPAYARPVFIRVCSAIEVTGTFKMVKGDLKQEGYNIDVVEDPLYVLPPRVDRYELLDQIFYESIKAGEAGY